ncbi:hypothetical protein EDB82DRAFT_131547 [Fusarium venenatum]|uniref:uncharacterized protein n=1 Tax=Fusarium venenatum TaxID=56646 RepID=UPI001E0EDF7E|nr:hypothetical protein EDB82DRAFT_131547 [Fusarium venenatum]
MLYQPNSHIGLILCLHFNACVQHHLKHDTSFCTSSLSGIRCIELNCYHLSFCVLSSLLSVHLLLLFQFRHGQPHLVFHFFSFLLKLLFFPLPRTLAILICTH